MREAVRGARLGENQAAADGAPVLEFRFAPEDPTFEGHFPTRPLLPGVYQLEMVRAAAERVLQCPLALGEITRAKFLRPIGPAETIRVELKLAEKPGSIQVRASFTVKGQPAGEALIHFTRIQ